MQMEILYAGGSIRIPRTIEEAYSTACLLEDGQHKVLIDPGTFVSFNMLEEALTKRNIALEDITDILLTHLHLDHAYATTLFPNATIYIHPLYKDKPYERFGLIKSRLYKEIMDSWRNVVPIEAGMELFGTVKVFHTPWHAREHCSFVIDTENMGKVFYTGDIVMNKVEFYDIIRWLRKDDCARFVNKIAKNCDYVVFTHDEYVKSSEYIRR